HVELLHDAAFGPRLRRDQRLAEQALRHLLRVVGRAHELDTAGLAAAAGVDLRLDDGEPAAEVGERLLRLVGRVDRDALRHRHAVARQHFLGLVLVDVHGRGRRAKRVASAGPPSNAESRSRAPTGRAAMLPGGMPMPTAASLCPLFVCAVLTGQTAVWLSPATAHAPPLDSGALAADAMGRSIFYCGSLHQTWIYDGLDWH